MKPDISSAQPRISIVVVADYVRGDESDWRDEERILRGLRDQDIAEPFEIVLAENETRRKFLSPELPKIAPRTRVLFANTSRSAALKDFGVGQTSGILVAVIEADCYPAPDWLRHLVETIDGHPDADIVSGRTTYGGGTSMRRVCALLDRSYVDIGVVGPTEQICNNGALYRREILEEHPYPDERSPFISSVLRLRSILRAGRRPYFQPNAAMIHDFGGFRLLADIRTHSGLRTARLRVLDGQSTKPRWRRSLAISLSHLKADIRNAARVGNAYIRPRDWPLFCVMVLFVRALEVRGILKGLDAEEEISATAYR
jgi:hypothetical protein